MTTRRNFLTSSASTIALAGVSGLLLENSSAAHVAGSGKIKIGLIGCGGRGTGAALQALQADDGVVIHAMGDVFEDRLIGSRTALSARAPEQVDVEGRTFTGFDDYQKVIESGVDAIYLATPPGFRPLHFAAAVEAGKHVFMEKPVATDAPGIRKVLEASALAKKKSLCVAVGLQRHHEPRYQETIKRLQDGAIGEIPYFEVYWMMNGVWVKNRDKAWTELEYQMRNWYYFTWICGDHIVEQHIHNIDVVNWVKDSHPVEAHGLGAQHGQIFDHHMVRFLYEDGTVMLANARHMPGTPARMSETAMGTSGSADISDAKIFDRKGDTAWQFGRGGGNGWKQEQVDFIAALRNGRVFNEADYGAHSTMTAILGRMATYSGQVVKWDEALANGKQLADPGLLTSFDSPAPVLPLDDGQYPIARPGVYSPFEK